jgi:signal transduction histidine kinase
MSRRTARAISITIAVIALVAIVVSIPVGVISGRDGRRDVIIVVPPERQDDIEAAIEQGDGCPSPGNDPELTETIEAYCHLLERLQGGPIDGATAADPSMWASFLIGIVWIATGYLIISRRGSNLSGWTFQAVGLGIILNAASLALVFLGVNTRPGSVPAIGLWATLGEYAFASIALLPMLWLLFPDGRPPTPRWRIWVRVYFAAIATAVTVAVLSPGPLNNLVDLGIVYLNPVGVPALGELGGVAIAAGVLTALGIAIASIVAVRRRFKRSTGEERQQLRWLRLVLSIALALLLLTFVGSSALALLIGEDTGFGWWFNVSFALLALTLALGIPGAYLIAIFRHGLWDLDVVIRKTLIVAVMGVTLTLLGIGSLVMVVPFSLFGLGGTAPDAATLIPVAVGIALGLLFGPIRRRAQRFADRVVYGQRATPYEVLSTFGDRLSETYAADDVLPRMAQVLAQATGADGATVWLRVGPDLRPEAVWPADAAMPTPIMTLADGAGNPDPAFVEVRHQGDLLGALSVTMPANDPLDPARSQLIADLAGQAGLVLRNVRLIEELRASRQRLVAAQDEERRKLERNIHDGVQQQLVALSVQLRLAEQIAAQDAGRTQELLAGLQGQTTEALEDLRDLARGIYPPLLAEQGLGPALQAQARKAVVPTTVDADGIGRYTRDVEATVYFCTLEAMNNIAKYAGASRTVIQLGQSDGALEFSVRDDGAGFDPAATTMGTGLVGIADRLDALGGRLDLESTPGRGTVVRGSLPVGHG